MVVSWISREVRETRCNLRLFLFQQLQRLGKRLGNTLGQNWNWELRIGNWGGGRHRTVSTDSIFVTLVLGFWDFGILGIFHDFSILVPDDDP